MAICEVTGKGKMYGHNVSFSQRHTRKVFKPNVSKRTLVINGQKIKCNVKSCEFNNETDIKQKILKTVL